MRVMTKCRKCGIGSLRIISEFNGNLAVVHCQNPECDVTYEEEIVPPASLRPKTRSGI